MSDPAYAAGDEPHPTRVFLAALLAGGEARPESAPLAIVDCHGIPRAELEAVPGFIYCGRGSRFYRGSALANPYREGADGPRAEAIARFEDWLYREREGEAKAVWETLAQLQPGSILGCWCVNEERAGEGPDDCHCDVIARAWGRLHTTA